MELHDHLILERFRLAVERQRSFAAAARGAFATYAMFVAGIAVVALTLVSARESLGLDTAVIPDALAMLASLLTFLAVVAAVQILAALIGWHRAHRTEAEIDPAAPRPHRVWWLTEAIYLLLIIASLIIGWRVLDSLAHTVTAGR